MMHWAVAGLCLVALVALGATKAVNNGNHFECPKANGKFLDPKHCQFYYICEDWEFTHIACNNGDDYNPWAEKCHSNYKDLMCKVYIHPENMHERHTYYISECNGEPKPYCTHHQGSDTCSAVGLDLVAIKNWDEDTFIKDFTREFEDEYHIPHRFTYWTCGYRTDQSTAKHRDFRWSQDHSYMGYTDWCDAGLTSEGQGQPKFPASCRPDELSHMCMHLNSSYIESYGWWDAAPCSVHNKNFAICEHNHDGEGTTTPYTGPSTTSTPYTGPSTTTSHGPTTSPYTGPSTTTSHGPTTSGPHPTTPTTRTSTPTSRPPRSTTKPIEFDDFLFWKYCEVESKHGFCDMYYNCSYNTEGEVMKHLVNCSGTDLFDNRKDVKACVDESDFVGDSCDDDPHPCTETGIFGHKKNCGMFYSCILDEDYVLHQKDYACPNGWLFDENKGYCIQYNADDTENSICPFDYQLEHNTDVVVPTEVPQCTDHFGPVRYIDDDEFIHCQIYHGVHGMLGPWYCPAGTVFKHGQCEFR